MPRFSRKTLVAVAIAAAMAGCGTVLGLDDIDYDATEAGARAATPDAARDVGDLPGEDGAAPDDDVSAIPADAVADVGAQSDGPFTLAQGVGAPQALAVDDANLYWINAQGAGIGAVESMLKDGGGTVVTIATAQPSPLDIAVNGTNVYWSVNQGGGPAVGGTSQCLAMLASKDGGALACATSGAFGSVRMAIAGSYVVVLSQSGTNMYIGFNAPGATYQNVETDGPALAMTATTQKMFLGNANGFHVDQMPLTASLTYGPIECQTNCGGVAIVNMTTDITGTNPLWASQAGGVFAMSTPPVAPMTASQLTQLGETPQRIARDASYIYVTTTSSVFAVPITPTDAGHSALTLATGEDHPFGIAVDDAYVYWTDADGTIRATSLPPAP